MTSEVVRIATEFKRQLDDMNLSAIKDMTEIYAGTYERLNDRVSRLMNEINALPPTLNEEVRLQWVRELEHYQRLRAEVSTELERFRTLAEQRAWALQQEAVRMAVQNANALTNASIKGMFKGLPTEAVEYLRGVLGSPEQRGVLGRLFDTITGGEYMAEFENVLYEGLTQGMTTKEIAERLTRVWAIPFQRASVIARTEINRAYRNSTRKTYYDSGYVTGYKRMASKAKACMACLMLDGTIYPVTAPLDDHPNGACVAVPIVQYGDMPEWETGKDFFLHLTPQEQSERMGAMYYHFWQEDYFGLDDLIGWSYSPEWGEAPRVVPLETLVPDWRALLSIQ